MSQVEYTGRLSTQLNVVTADSVRVWHATFAFFGSRAIMVDSPRVVITGATFLMCHSSAGPGGAIQAVMNNGHSLRMKLSCFESCSSPGTGQSYCAWNREEDYTIAVSHCAVTNILQSEGRYSFILLGGANTLEAQNVSHTSVPFAFRLGGYTKDAPSTAAHCLTANCTCGNDAAAWIGLGGNNATHGATVLETSIFAKLTEANALLRVDYYDITVRKCVFVQSSGILYRSGASDAGCSYFMTECAFDAATTAFGGTYKPTVENLVFNYQGDTTIQQLESIQCIFVTREMKGRVCIRVLCFFMQYVC